MLSISTLKNYIKTNGSVSLAELGLIIKEDNDTVQCLMQHLINKGCVRECRLTPQCGTKCVQCPTTQTIIYQWAANA